MTDKQPEALRLADHLEHFRSFPKDLEAAAELRRLHAENVALRAALRQHIRTHQVPDEHWDPEKEADRLMGETLKQAAGTVGHGGVAARDQAIAALNGRIKG